MGDLIAWYRFLWLTASCVFFFSQPTRSSSESICSRPGSSIPGSPGHTIYVRYVTELCVQIICAKAVGSLSVVRNDLTLCYNNSCSTVLPCSLIVQYYSSNLPLLLSVCTCLSLFVSLGKSRQWDPWLQRPSCYSKSQSHLWHWAPWSYYLWTYVHHLPGWERGETRECGRGKYTDCMLLFLHAHYLCAHTVLCIKRYVLQIILCFALGYVSP